MKRAKNLDGGLVLQIVEILDGWDGPLSWEKYIDSIEKRIGQRYTRQALFKHADIRLAFVTRKKKVAVQPLGVVRRTGDPILNAALERQERLEAENERIKAENRRLLEMFARWTYNASSRGLSKEFLDQSLPSIDRGQTNKTKKAKRS